MPSCVMVSRAVTVTVTSLEERGRGYFLFRCHQFPLHAWCTHTRTHPRTIDRFIIACQESAGFTFQQNGPIWRANNGKPPRPSRRPAAPFLHLTLLNPASSRPAPPTRARACQPTQPNPERHRLHVSVTSFVSAFFLHEQEKRGRNGSFRQWESLCADLKCFTALMGLQK